MNLKKLFFLLFFSFQYAYSAYKQNIYLAIYNGNLEKVAQLIDQGISIDKPNSDGDTPLHLAAKYNHFHIVKYLIERGANIYAQNNQKEEPIDITSSSNIIVALLEKEWFDHLDKYSEKKVKKSDLENTENINLALAERKIEMLKKLTFSLSFAVILCLIKNNALAMIETFPLHKAAISSNNIAEIDRLLNQGYDINEKETDLGQTPLHIAVGHSNLPLIIFFLEHGADINATDMFQNRPLHELFLNASRLRSSMKKELTLIFLNKGADINCQNIFKFTPAHYAAIRYDREMLDFLITKQADISLENDFNYTPFDLLNQNAQESDLYQKEESKCCLL